MKKVNYLCYFIVLLTLISAGTGIFYSTGGDSFAVKNIYGESIELYGNGIYKYNSILKAGGFKGTDLVMLIVAVLFTFFTVKKEKATEYGYLQIGFLAGLLYYSSCLVFGVTFNSLFPIYVLLFSSTLFTMILILSDLIKNDNLTSPLVGKKFKGTALFLIISGSSVLMWLQFIIPSLVTGQQLSIIEIYTT